MAYSSSFEYFHAQPVLPQYGERQHSISAASLQKLETSKKGNYLTDLKM